MKWYVFSYFVGNSVWSWCFLLFQALDHLSNLFLRELFIVKGTYRLFYSVPNTFVVVYVVLSFVVRGQVVEKECHRFFNAFCFSSVQVYKVVIVVLVRVLLAAILYTSFHGLVGDVVVQYSFQDHVFSFFNAAWYCAFALLYCVFLLSRSVSLHVVRW